MIYEAFVFYASNADNPQWRKFIFFTSLLALMEELSAGRSVTVEDKHNLSLVTIMMYYQSVSKAYVIQWLALTPSFLGLSTS